MFIFISLSTQWLDIGVRSLVFDQRELIFIFPILTSDNMRTFGILRVASCHARGIRFSGRTRMREVLSRGSRRASGMLFRGSNFLRAGACFCKGCVCCIDENQQFCRLIAVLRGGGVGGGMYLKAHLSIIQLQTRVRIDARLHICKRAHKYTRTCSLQPVLNERVNQ